VTGRDLAQILDKARCEVDELQRELRTLRAERDAVADRRDALEARLRPLRSAHHAAASTSRKPGDLVAPDDMSH
jgi:hypothetical protein